jgi:hypothetical protein
VEKLAHDWHIAPYWLTYIALGILLQAFMRGVMSALGAFELANVWYDHKPPEKWRVYFGRNLIGVHPGDREGEKSDFWVSSILGLLELWSYPIMMATGAWAIIGAWLSFKTVAQWRTWRENRFSYNRYLIGNALVVLLSLMVLVRFVTISPPVCAP